MKNELGFDTALWKDPDSGMHFARGMHMDMCMGYAEGTAQILADMLWWNGRLTSTQLEWMHRKELPKFQKPMNILTWMRRHLELPFLERVNVKGELVSVYSVTDTDKEILQTAFFYLQCGYVAEEIERQNDRHYGEDGMD
jgi:hypothetical protein